MGKTSASSGRITLHCGTRFSFGKRADDRLETGRKETSHVRGTSCKLNDDQLTVAIDRFVLMDIAFFSKDVQTEACYIY